MIVVERGVDTLVATLRRAPKTVERALAVDTCLSVVARRVALATMSVVERGVDALVATLRRAPKTGHNAAAIVT